MSRKNPKNIRRRSGTYIELSGVKFLIDTSPDLRMQLIDSNIKQVDAVFYTHTHADHLHGIDDLREVNRISGKAMGKRCKSCHFTVPSLA